MPNVWLPLFVVSQSSLQIIPVTWLWHRKYGISQDELFVFLSVEWGQNEQRIYPEVCQTCAWSALELFQNQGLWKPMIQSVHAKTSVASTAHMRFTMVQLCILNQAIATSGWIKVKGNVIQIEVMSLLMQHIINICSTWVKLVHTLLGCITPQVDWICPSPFV